MGRSLTGNIAKWNGNTGSAPGSGTKCYDSVMASSTSSIFAVRSRLYLPKLERPPRTVLEYLVKKFPDIPEAVWAERASAGKLVLNDERLVDSNTAYLAGDTVHYFREVAEEPRIPFEEKILFENDEIIVVDKPHFLPVVPSGSYVNECLLARLQRRFNSLDLSPAHRIDAATAGLVLFSKAKKARHLYQNLFQAGAVEKFYEAICWISGQFDAGDRIIAARLERGEPWFRRRIAEGPANAITRVHLAKRWDALGFFEVYPTTGKKHQIRVHLASIGCPIVNDPYYPVVRNESPQDYSRPLQLLAKKLSFADPVTGQSMGFESQQSLDWPPKPGHVSR